MLLDAYIYWTICFRNTFFQIEIHIQMAVTFLHTHIKLYRVKARTGSGVFAAYRLRRVSR